MDIKRILPYIISIVVFYLATLSYFYPELIDNKSLGQTDVVQFEGMSKSSVDYKKRNDGKQALWNDAMFSGVPDYLIATGVPEAALLTIKQITHGFLNKKTSAHILFTHMFCFWVLLLSFKVRPWLAMIGALAFGFSSYNIINIEAGHVTKSWAIAYSALVLAGIHLVFKKKLLFGFGILATGLSLQIGAPHYQITFYLVFVCLAYAISEFVYALKEKQLAYFAKQSGIMIIAIVLAFGTAVGRLWMTQEYTPHSIRGEQLLSSSETSEGDNQNKQGLDKEYAFSWSQGKMETFTLLIPYFYGGGSGEMLEEGSHVYKSISKSFGKQQADRLTGVGPVVPLYYGDQPFTSGPLYMGAIICFLFVLAMLVLPNRLRWWILAGTILSMMFAWGRNLSFFNYFLFDYFPGFNKFRTVSMALSMTMMLMPLAGILAVDKLIELKLDNILKKKLLYALLATGGLAFLFAVFGGMGSFTTPADTTFPQRLGINDNNVAGDFVKALRDDRLSYMRQDAFRSGILILLAGGVLYLVLIGKISKSITLIILGVLIVGDVWFVGKRYLYPEQFRKNAVKQAHQKSAADASILKDKDPHYRVFTIGSFDKEAQTSYYHKSIGGYFAAKLMRYKDLIERKLYPEQNTIIGNLRQGNPPNYSQLPALNMLNAKYIKYGAEANQVLRNPAALGNAWFVEEIQSVNDDNEAIQALNGLNPSKTAIINAVDFEINQTNFELDSMAKISLTSYDQREMIYKSNNQNDGLAVFSEIYYPDGWTATIDGEPIEILRANYLLRALKVPAGQHEIKFSFNPKSYVAGTTISSISGYIVAFILVISLVLPIWEKFKKNP